MEIGGIREMHTSTAQDCSISLLNRDTCVRGINRCGIEREGLILMCGIEREGLIGAV
jgi:hypothetical protein